TKGSGPFHSQSMETIYAHYPGLIVMTPATVEDAYTMLIDAVAIDDPVVYCEHKYLYYHLKADKLPDKGLPTGRARIAREGRDVTIVSYSAMTQESLAAAEELAREGLEVEVVDLRTVKPLDTDTVLASVARTGRLLCVGESIAEATIVDIKVKSGDEVVDDQEIIDVETNKAVMGVTTPCKGKIARITVELKETYPVGAVLGYVEASEQDAARFAKHAPPPPEQKEVAEEIPVRADQEVAPARGKKIAPRDGDGERGGGLPVPAITKGATFMSPRVRARMAELQLTTADLAGIMGTGGGNRVTIKDLESFLHKIENQTAHEASKIRAGVADAMRRSWTRPLSTIGSSVSLEPVLQHRQSRDPKPGLGLYALRALALV